MDDSMDREPDARGRSVQPGSHLDPRQDGQPADLSASDLAFALFYRAETPKLVRFLLWQGACLADAADLAQEAMILAYRNWARLHTNPGAWLRRTASRAYLRRISTAREDPAGHVLEPSPLLGHGVEEWEQRHDLLAALATLPARQRQVLAWTLDEYTPDEIAKELELAPEAVRASLYKGRRALAKHLRIAGEEDLR